MSKNEQYIPPCENPTMLYKLGGEYKHYEPKLGYIDYDYIIVDKSEVSSYVAEGWGLNVTEMYLDSKKPKEVVLTSPIELPLEPEFTKSKGKKTEVLSDNNL